MQADTRTLYVQLTWSDIATGEGREFVGPLPVTLGRTADNTIVLNSNRISRRHAMLRAEAGRVILQDTQSTNGTFVNEARITELPLSSGSGFQIGPFHFIMT
ncbi:MAG TPA: FHA domain-containing protein, partial [Ktedonobacteraceae bacterium]|nr:FHA domain-containing protein [Ktedonobacteraceae bacterium]